MLDFTSIAYTTPQTGLEGATWAVGVLLFLLIGIVGILIYKFH